MIEIYYVYNITNFNNNSIGNYNIKSSLDYIDTTNGNVSFFYVLFTILKAYKIQVIKSIKSFQYIVFKSKRQTY